jgi:SAM-dependent methyltransferase
VIRPSTGSSRGLVRRWAKAARARVTDHPPPPGHVRLGSLDRLVPVSQQYGFDRGLPVDRHYIEDFLRRYAGEPGYGQGDVHGRVLEVGGDDYARKFGNWNSASSTIEHLDVLHADASNPLATVIGDLAGDAGLEPSTYDCVICTQTLHTIYDVSAAIHTLHDALKPGGVAFVTVAGISRSITPDRDLWGDYWRFTSSSARRLFAPVFGSDNVHVEAYGNVLSAVAFLHGMAAEELRENQLSPRDPAFEVLIAVRATRAIAEGA